MSTFAKSKVFNLNSSGFSLVELMVSVGIIGILASVAIPQYSKFTNRAKQSEARVKLGSLYTIEKAFYVEANKYSSCLAGIGFTPEDTPTTRYAVGFQSVGTNTNVTGSVTCADGVNNTYFTANAKAAPGFSATRVANTNAKVEADTANNFNAAADGWLKSGTYSSGQVLDQWIIDQKQELKNVQSGI